MTADLKKLNFRTFAKSSAKMYDLLDTNRIRLAPWFWWADKKITPNKFRFYIFMILYIVDTKRKKIAHKLNHDKLYDEQFFIYYGIDNICGMCGLDNIDRQNEKNAELWYLTFQGTPFGTADTAIQWVEQYSMNLGLDSLYAKIQSTNDKSIKLLERNSYTIKNIQNNVQISKRNSGFADMYTYEKQLSR